MKPLCRKQRENVCLSIFFLFLAPVCLCPLGAQKVKKTSMGDGHGLSPSHQIPPSMPFPPVRTSKPTKQNPLSLLLLLLLIMTSAVLCETFFEIKYAL